MKRAAHALTRWSRLTGRHKLAVVILGIWALVTARLFLSGDPVWIGAQAANYGALTSGALLFAAASLGLRQWGDIQSMQYQPSFAPSADMRATEDGPEPISDVLQSPGTAT